MKKMHSLNVIVCAGKPNSGKSTFAAALNTLSASQKDNRGGAPDDPTTSTVYRLDRAYVDFTNAAGLGQPGRTINIAKHFPERSDAQKAQFWEFVSKELDAYIKSTQFTLIVEGWQAYHYEKELRAKFEQHRLVFLTIENGSFEALGKRFTIPRLPLERYETDFSFYHNKRAMAVNVAVASELFCYMREKAIAELTAETKYQCFDDLGMDKTASDSPAKFEALHLQDALPSMRGGPKRVLDVGAQSGNFCFRIAKMALSYRVTGIEMRRKPAMLACRYNTQVYELPNIEFKQGDVLDCKLRNFDLVIAASVFHYFRERQQEFLDQVFDMLKPGGILVLECGVSKENPGEPHVQLFARKVDGDLPCHFPNRMKLTEMTQRFTKAYEGPSVTQRGDPIPRYVFHFKKPAA